MTESTFTPPGYLILASTSPYRRALMERLGLPFRTVSPDVDEAAEASRLAREVGGDYPRSLAEHLARAKACALVEVEPDATLIGSDQLVAFGDQILGKPGTPEAAIEQLAMLAGSTHRLVTALAVRHRGRLYEHTDISFLTIRSLDREALRRYVDADRPWDCAGSYKLESRGIALMERIETADPTAITGLPLIALTNILRSLGYPIP